MSDFRRGGGGGGGPMRHNRRGGGQQQNHPYQRDGGWRGGRGGGGDRGGGRDEFDSGRIQYRGPHRGGGGGGGNRDDRDLYRGPPTTSGPFIPSAVTPLSSPPPPPLPKIDRTKICPLLLRVYIQNDAHHSASSFAVRGEEPMEDSIIIYTWPDASLRELAGLIQQVNADSLSTQREISFAFVYPDKTGTNVIKHVMTIPTTPVELAGANKNGNRNRGGGGAAAAALARQLAADQKQLRQLGFETGDSLSVALLQKK